MLMTILILRYCFGKANYLSGTYVDERSECCIKILDNQYNVLDAPLEMCCLMLLLITII